jgi:hypothetical protein
MGAELKGASEKMIFAVMNRAIEAVAVAIGNALFGMAFTGKKCSSEVPRKLSLGRGPARRVFVSTNDMSKERAGVWSRMEEDEILVD